MTNVNDGGPGSLRDAILQSNVAPGAYTINFSPSAFATPQTIALAGGALGIRDSPTIDASAVAPVTVSAGNLGFNVFVVDDVVVGTVVGVTLRGLTITGGSPASRSPAAPRSSLRRWRSTSTATARSTPRTS